jgi:hypothetical protein
MAFTKKWGYNSTDDYNGSSEDVYMYKDNPDTTHDDDNIWLGTFANANRITRALIRFAIKDDLTSLGDISIISAKLYLYTNTLNGTHNVSAFRVVQDWNEAELTWNSFKSGGSWNSPGVESASDSAVDDDVTYDRFLTAEDIKSSGSVGGYNCILDLTSLTQKWFSGDNKEYGVFLLSDNESINNNVQFIDHEGSDGQRPYLEIEYEIVFNPGEWSNKLKLTVDGSKIDGDMTDFPALIALSSNSGQTGFDATDVFDELTTASGSYVNRKKIAVTTTVSGVETELYIEIDRWDDTTSSGNEQAWLWTKVPTIVSGTDTELYLYYDKTHSGNTDHVGDVGDTVSQNVWDSNFNAVFHFSEDSYTGAASEIRNSVSGTDGHAINAAQPFSALIGNGLDVDDADKGALTESNINPGNVYTAESFFYKPWSTASVNALFRSISPNQYFILIDTDNLLAVYEGSWRKSTYNLSTISDGWHHLSAVSDDTNTYFYVDGDYVDRIIVLAVLIILEVLLLSPGAILTRLGFLMFSDQRLGLKPLTILAWMI